MQRPRPVLRVAILVLAVACLALTMCARSRPTQPRPAPAPQAKPMAPDAGLEQGNVEQREPSRFPATKAPGRLY
ncbi:MAG: hypothetical protein WKG01_06765 [Kofleriaceae bacterium]